jgi:hypothetical protein
MASRAQERQVVLGSRLGPPGDRGPRAERGVPDGDAQQPAELVGPGDPVDQGVQLPLDVLGCGVAPVDGRDDLTLHRVELLDVGVGEVQRGPAGQLAREVRLRVVDVDEVLAAHLDDAEAPAGTQLHQPFPGQRHQGLADGRGADPEAGGEVLGAQRAVAPRLPAHDHLADADRDLRGEALGGVDRELARARQRAGRVCCLGHDSIIPLAGISPAA